MSFIDLRYWWKHDSRKVMSQIYWFKSQLPPIDSDKYDKAWKNISEELNKKYPKPE